MERFLKLTIAYDGGGFVGWQVQAEGRSVQGDLEAAWQKVTGEQKRLTASGRTDSGVHAVGQVASVATETRLDNHALLRALNASLAFDVRVLRVDDAPQEFHAIRDALSKRYRYWIQDSPIRDPFYRDRCWWIPRALQLEAMQDACQHFLGTHDFASFQSAGSPRLTTERTVMRLDIRRQPTDLASLLEVNIAADGFLYNMVRNIVGTLVEIGHEKRKPDWPLDIFAAQDRKQAGPTAPAVGLCLVEVHYP